MPMPPPKPEHRARPAAGGSGGRSSRSARALADSGPTDRDTLATAVGAAYWEPGRFDARPGRGAAHAARSSSTPRRHGWPRA